MDSHEIPKKIIEKAIGLKKKWSNVYCFKIGEMYFLTRLLSRREFLQFIDLEQYMLGEQEDFIFNLCVLYPKLKTTEIDYLNAGIVTSIADSVIRLSGFSSPDVIQDLIESNRNAMELVDNQIVATLCKAFPGLDPEQISDFDIQKLSYYLAIAEQILGVTLEFKIEKQKTNNQIDFAAENKQMGGPGAFGNMDPRMNKP